MLLPRRQDRPVVPWLTDGLACSICGGDGHTAHYCPKLWERALGC